MENLLVSVSGGQTSALMAKRINDAWRGIYNLVFVFANTGAENEETLIFVDKLARYLGVTIIWVEAVVRNGRLGCAHKIVTFETASRNYEPYEAMIEKYGIPNKAYPHCTRELKLNPIKSYLRSIGWKKYKSAVGIRVDEPKRKPKKPNSRIIHPMTTVWPTTKTEVNEFWEAAPFELGLPDYRGNCKFCWKKSLAKLTRIAAETPAEFDFPARMERDKGLSGHNMDGNPRVFFRENMSALEILEIARNTDYFPPIRKDEDEGCSQSCEAFAA